jgi:sugar fermentation stimulation protein A
VAVPRPAQSGNPARRYPRTLEQVEVAPGVVVGVHPGRANALVAEALDSGLLPALRGYRARRREWRYGKEGSRADFLLEEHRAAPPCVLEVKSVTALAAPGVAEFPDAVTVRGTRHLRELAARARAGGRAALVFCVQRADVSEVRPARGVDPDYADALARALSAGVEVHALAARVGPRELVLYREVPVSPA